LTSAFDHGIRRGPDHVADARDLARPGDQGLELRRRAIDQRRQRRCALGRHLTDQTTRIVEAGVDLAQFRNAPSADAASVMSFSAEVALANTPVTS
jgi:hypothetical protein